ncbi:MAG: hypothetical protein U0Q16_30905 [Bryobacteraceae bacterium]
MRKITVLLPLWAAWAQAPLSYTISTIAGGARTHEWAAGKRATEFSLDSAGHFAGDRQGNLYIPFTSRNIVVRVRPDGTASLFAGTPDAAGFAGDGGQATNARLNQPTGVAVDPQGRVLIFDFINFRIRRVDTSGIITTVGGTGEFPASLTDPSAKMAPRFGTVSPAGDTYFFDVDFGSARYRLRKMSADGSLATVGPDLGTSPNGVAVDAQGNVYASFGGRVARIATGGVITNIISVAQSGFAGDGGASSAALLNNPFEIAVDSAGNLFIADALNHRVRMIRNDSSGAVATGRGVISTVAGTGTSAAAQSGPAATTALSEPFFMTIGGSDDVYVYDQSLRILRFKSGGALEVAAGQVRSVTSPDGVEATKTPLLQVVGLVYDNGSLTFSDAVRVRTIGSNGLVATLSGLDVPGFTGNNGPAKQALHRAVASVARDSKGNLYTADTGGGGVRKISPDGQITQVAGIFAPVDGQSANAVNCLIANAVAVDAQDNLYVGCAYSVRKVDASGKVTRYAGSDTTAVSRLQSGASLNADIFFPDALTFDKAGNLYVSDTFNTRISRFGADGQFVTIAGQYGNLNFTGDGGSAIASTMRYPSGIAIDDWGSVYFVDRLNQRVRKISATGTISTIAGNGTFGFSGDGGPALSAQLWTAGRCDVAVDPAGNVFFVDTVNRRIRKLTANKISAPGPLTLTPGERFSFSGIEVMPSTGKPNVLVNGIPATDVTVDKDTVSAVAPASLTGDTAKIEVEIRGARTNAITVSLGGAKAKPAISAITNEDGSANSEGTPAAAGSVVTISLTGADSADGGTISARIGDVTLELVEVSGVEDGRRRVVVRIPAEGLTGAQTVVVAVGDAVTDGQPIWIQ